MVERDGNDTQKLVPVTLGWGATQGAYSHRAKIRVCGWICISVLVGCAGGNAPRPPLPPVDSGAAAVIATPLGEIEFELLDSAAPTAVQRLLAVLPEVDRKTTSPFTGRAFDHTRSRVEIQLQAPEPTAEYRVRTEISAGALGLDERRIEDAGQAMDTLQFELLPAYRERRKSGNVEPQLEEWMKVWFAQHRAEFLVGVSRRDVLEALGHRFEEGPRSEAVRRGSVFLVPASATESDLRLGFAISDLPRLEGKAMVVGRVVRGMEVIEGIAARPLARPERKDFAPLEPLRVVAMWKQAFGKGKP